MRSPLPDSALCRDCGYALRGLTALRCPECGLHFDPNDPTSYRDPRFETPWFDRVFPYRLPRPPSGPYTASVFGFTLLVFLFSLTADGSFVWAAWSNPYYLPLGGAVVVDYVVRLIRLRSAKAAGHEEVVKRFAERPDWPIFTLCIILLTTLMICPWPASVRFYVSYWPMSQAADEFLARRRAGTGSQWIGVVHVEQVWGHGRGFVFFQTGHDDDRYGYVYRPQGRTRKHAARWIAPSWYLERR